jgi:hypothetical protein
MRQNRQSVTAASVASADLKPGTSRPQAVAPTLPASAHRTPEPTVTTIPATATTALPAALAERALVCEYASLTRDGRPVTWPVTPYAEDGTTVDVSTGLTYPAKAERARRDPRVAVSFSAGADGMPDAPVVLVQGLATVRDADLQAGLDRYLRQTRAKMPQTYQGLPTFAIRRMDWYLARIWVQVTPLRVLSWAGGRLDREPEVWHAPEGTTAPPSDPAPEGPPLPSRSTRPADWRPFADRADRLGLPVLTVVGEDGWPLPVRCRGVARTIDGYLVELPAGISATAGAACLTWHVHTPGLASQENVVMTGSARPTAGGHVEVRVDRALTDWSITGSRLGRTLGFLANGKALRPRLEAEARRRGQPAPKVRI